MFATYAISQLVTVLYLVADPRSTEVAIGNAGHLPPLLIHSDGATEFLDVPPSVPLGARPERRDNSPVTLLAGQTLLLYTDGLIERRDEDIDVGLDRLAEHAAMLATSSLSAGLNQLIDVVHDGQREDDITAVAIRFDG
jgi:serine phosphatase RsbU (regulator of sigma subunit)